VGASFGPIVAGKLRAISWNYAFVAAAIAIGVMLLITIFFYKEPERELKPVPLRNKLMEIVEALSDIKFLIFLILIGIFFWLPFWAFFNLLAIYIDGSLDTATLYQQLRGVFGTAVANFFSHPDENGTWRLLGETVSHTGYVIMIFQVLVSRIFEKRPAVSTFLIGLGVLAAGFILLGYANISSVAWVFLGITFVAIGEMISSPRIQEYITWIAPKEKAGLYMGTNFLAIGLGGALSGVVYTSLFGIFKEMQQPEFVWFTLAAHMILGIIAMQIFTRSAGEFKELEE
jgi:MFS family permease